MELNPDSILIRIFVGEIDKYKGHSLFEAILQEARKYGMAGCSAMKGILSFGASSKVHTARWVEISEDLPIVVEIVDTEEKVTDFLEVVNKMIDEAGCGGLVTMEKATVLTYRHRHKSKTKEQ